MLVLPTRISIFIIKANIGPMEHENILIIKANIGPMKHEKTQCSTQVNFQ